MITVAILLARVVVAGIRSSSSSLPTRTVPSRENHRVEARSTARATARAKTEGEGQLLSASSPGGHRPRAPSGCHGSDRTLLLRLPDIGRPSAGLAARCLVFLGIGPRMKGPGHGDRGEGTDERAGDVDPGVFPNAAHDH